MNSPHETKNIPKSHAIVMRCSLSDTIVEIPQIDQRNVRYLAKKNHDIEESCDVKMKTIILIDMDASVDDMLYVRLVDNITDEFEFSEIMQILETGKEFFENMDLTQRTISRVQSWINRLGRSSYIWNNLTNKPDYNLELQKKRFYPFYHIKSREWKQIANNALQENRPADYPPTNAKIFEKGSDDAKDFTMEKSVSQKHNNFMSYPVLNPSKYGNIEEHVSCIATLIKLGLTNEAMEAFLRLCITPSCCHIIKNTKVWHLIYPLINDAEAKNIVMYSVYYAQYILRHESTKMFSQVSRSYRVLFNYAELEIQPDAHDMHIERDPYIQQLPDDTFISQTVTFYLREKRPINPSNVFERRLFLATGGALAGINLKKMKAAVSGSILIPCVSRSPLEERFIGFRTDPVRKIRGYVPAHHSKYYKLNSDDLDFISYLEYFYPSYDSLKDHEYEKEVLTEKNEKLVKFDMKKYIEEKEKETDTNNKEQKMPEYNKLADIDISLTTPTYDEFRENAMTLFKQIRKNVAFRGPVWILEIETLSSFKFKIYGPGLTRPIDLFRIPYDAAKMVKKFHVPCVRMWYEGQQKVDISDGEINFDFDTAFSNGLHIYDSCVRSMKSGINNTYKWFSCNKIPADVLLKYASRGIASMLNKKERTAIVEYIKSSPRWKSLIDTDASGEISDSMDIFGVMSLHHKFFHPANYNSGIRMGLRNNLFSEDETFYSKRSSINYPEHNTTYGGNLAIKTNNSVNPPKLENITKYIGYLKDDSWISDDEE